MLLSLSLFLWLFWCAFEMTVNFQNYFKLSMSIMFCNDKDIERTLEEKYNLLLSVVTIFSISKANPWKNWSINFVRTILNTHKHIQIYRNKQTSYQIPKVGGQPPTQGRIFRKNELKMKRISIHLIFEICVWFKDKRFSFLILNSIELYVIIAHTLTVDSIYEI